MNNGLTIGKLASLSGVSTKTVRYYEGVGILPTPQRNKVGYRIYADIDVRRLDLIRRARLLGMGLDEVRELSEWASSGTCNDFQNHFQEAVGRKLDEVDKRIADLGRLKQDLLRIEAHFASSEKEVKADHTVLECSPDTCTCLGNSTDEKDNKQEVMLWLNRPEPKS